jgi:hypothetical protein
MELIERSVYELNSGELAVFKYIGLKGDPVWGPLGEPSTQDAFILKDWKKSVKRFVRHATNEDLGRD